MINHRTSWWGKAQQHMMWLIPLGVFLFYLVLIAWQKGLVDSTDGLMHYAFAKHGFSHPEGLVNHWAKPLFTLIACLPAQAGPQGIALLNALLIALASYWTLRSARQLNLGAYALAPLLLVASNGLSYVVLGGLTEPLFIAGFSLTIHSALRQRWSLAMCIAGALVMVRPEAIVVLPGMGLWALISRQGLKVLHAAWIPLIYTLVGVTLFGKDLTWILSDQPYGGQGAVYGQGLWTHYLTHWQAFTSFSVMALAILGLAQSLRLGMRALRLIGAMAIGILLLHASLWAFGSMGSAGLPRTLTTSLPALILLAVAGLEWVSKSQQRHAIYWLVALITLGVFIINNPYPKALSDQESAAISLAESLNDHGHFHGQKVAFQYAAIGHYLNIDPFDDSKGMKLYHVNAFRPSLSLTLGDLIIHDNVTGHIEGGLLLQTLKADNRLLALDSVQIGHSNLYAFACIDSQNDTILQVGPEQTTSIHKPHVELLKLPANHPWSSHDSLHIHVAAADADQLELFIDGKGQMLSLPLDSSLVMPTSDWYMVIHSSKPYPLESVTVIAD